jgi:hypothetical protein
MKKVIIWFVGLFITIIFIMALMFFSSARKLPVAILKDYNICYGDSPKTVASKISGTCIEREQLSYANKTVYTFETKIFDTSTEMSCFFLNDKHLSEVYVTIQANETEQITALFERAVDIIRETYGKEDTFICRDIVFNNDGSYSQSLGLKDGAVGIDYMVLAKDKALYVTCVDCR